MICPVNYGKIPCTLWWETRPWKNSRFDVMAGCVVGEAVTEGRGEKNTLLDGGRAVLFLTQQSGHSGPRSQTAFITVQAWKN